LVKRENYFSPPAIGRIVSGFSWILNLNLYNKKEVFCTNNVYYNLEHYLIVIIIPSWMIYDG